MAGNLTAETFVKIVLQSQLIDLEGMNELLDSYKKSGIKTDDPLALGQEFVKSGKLTSWQVEKLLQGKHKGFILGKYHLLSLLGKGGMSSVYLAEHRLMHRRCAIKVLPAKRVHDSSYLGRFHREAQAVASMDHQNIVRAYDVDHVTEGSTDIHFLVMEYVQGNDLQEVVLKNGLLDFTSAADYIRQSADGLAHAHQTGMVHRDIKPANLLLDKTNVVKILDMGLARFFEESDEKSLTVTHDEKVLGTADYLSPEQALDSHKVDSRADIYSLGCTIYFLLTGQPPFNTGTLAQRLLAHQTQDPPTIRNFRPDIPDSLLLIIEKMMQKKVEDRYQTAEEVSNVLVGWLLENGGEEWKKNHPNIQVKQLGDQSAIIPASSSGENKLEISSGFDIDVPLKPLEDENQDKKSESSTRKRRSRSGIRRSSQSEINKENDSKTLINPRGAKDRSTSKIQEDGTESESSSNSSKILRSETPLTDLDDNTLVPEVPSDGEMEIVVAEIVDEDEIQEADAVFEDDSDPEIANLTAASSILLKKAALDDGKFDLILFLTQNRLAQTILAAVFLFLVVAVGTLLINKSPSGNNGRGGVGTGTKIDGAETLNVGNDENSPFDKIGKALNLFKHKIKGNKSYKAVIEVAPGRYNENIHLNDISDGALTIICKEGTAVLYPDGGKAVISLSNCQNISIDGFQIKAQDKSVAIKLSGILNGTSLKNLDVSGFTKTGIECSQIRGSSRTERVVLENIVLKESKQDPSGITISGSDPDLSFISLEKISFLSPMKTGIQIEGELFDVKISNCRFNKLNDGIVIASSRPKIVSFYINNNTFNELKGNSVIFNGMPASQSKENGIFKNIFSNGASSDIVMKQSPWSKNIFTDKFNILNFVHNFTTRKNSNLTQEIPVFTDGKNFATAIEFSSTDPSSNLFLNIKSLKLDNEMINTTFVKTGAE
jgi:eukaryotic-like serine/threonine-protein kinase